jgi:hypothetical protein
VANLVVSAVSTFDNKGLKKGSKDISAFDKSVKKLGKTFASVFAARSIMAFSKKAVNAFMADEAAAKSLELQLKNTGYAFSAPDVEYYIANLQKMYGVLDDQLRPAFQTLLTASGSITKSQKALAIALDISAATGKSVEEVSAAIAKGYTGQTTALARLGAGIDKTTLASGDMNLILDEASKKFSGQALARLETYAGKMDQLKVATANASEIIGKDLLDSLSAFSKDDTLSGFDDLLSGLATKLASIDKAVFGFVARLVGIKKQSVNFTYSLGANAGKDIARAKEAAIIKKTNAARATELAALNKKTAVDQLKDKFDLERIGLTAALNSATDEETKLRLKSQLSILDNNEALAKKYLAEMNAAEAAKKLAVDLTAAGDKAYQAFNGILNLLGRGGDQGPGQVAQYSTNVIPSPGAGQIGGPSVLLGAGGDQGPGRVTVNIDASNMIDSSNMTRVVQQAFLEINKNGYSTVPAGQGF